MSNEERDMTPEEEAQTSGPEPEQAEPLDGTDETEELKAKLSGAEEARLRAMAELENVKRRLTREMEEYKKYATESVIAELIPVIDNLDLAIQHGGTDEACKGLLMGVEMTRKIFLDSLVKQGMEIVGEVGEPFNPEVHEAMGFEEGADKQDNTVCQVMQKGYVLKGRLLRSAKVMVGRNC